MSARLFLSSATLLLLLSTLGHSAEKAAKVIMYGKPADVQSTDNTVLYDKGLVPARPTAEALGGRVEWDSESRTLKIIGPNSSGSIRVGSRVAYIGGSRVYFDYPATIYNDYLYIPIIMFNRMFNKALIYDRFYNRLRWVNIFPRSRYYDGGPPPVLYNPNFQLPEPSTRASSGTTSRSIPATGVVVGEVAELTPSRANATISILSGGQKITYFVPDSAIIVRGRIGENGTEIPLSAVRPGDRVMLRFDEAGNVTSIRAQYKQTAGKVQAIAGNTILLESGETLRVNPSTEFVLPDNTTGEFGDVHVGDSIVASLSPISGAAYVIKLAYTTTTASPEAQGDDQLMLNSSGPFRTGDTVSVDFRAKVGGQAFFSIPGVREDIHMQEVEPGHYQGQYTVQEGDILPSRPVTVRFVTPDGQTFVRTSRQSITIRTAGGSLPQIIAPRQGDEINTPIFVEGIAEPGSLVRVTVEYRANPGHELPISGVSDLVDVRADAKGNWKTRALSAVAPFDETTVGPPFDIGIFTGVFKVDKYPIVYLITATRIGRTGQAQASYTVQVTRAGGKDVGGGLGRDSVEP